MKLRRTPPIRWLIVCALSGGCVLALLLIPPTPDEAAVAAPAQAPLSDNATLTRGEYVAKAGDCAGCHTAAQGGAPLAGGLGLASPFGTIMSSNITPDKQFGVGQYSYEDFARAMREGVARGGKRLYPAMPYASFAKVSDDDMRALYEYIMHRV